jgi:hypothetical protein
MLGAPDPMPEPNKTRYPVVSNFLRVWTEDRRRGILVLPLGRTRDKVEIAWVRYRAPEYFLGLHALGTATFGGRPLRVSDTYRYHSITNSRETRFERTERSQEGLCGCGELVMALDAGQMLAFEASGPGIWTLDVQLRVDQSFHEVESDDIRCMVQLERDRGELRLDRRYFRDAST